MGHLFGPCLLVVCTLFFFPIAFSSANAQKLVATDCFNESVTVIANQPKRHELREFNTTTGTFVSIALYVDDPVNKTDAVIKSAAYLKGLSNGITQTYKAFSFSSTRMGITGIFGPCEPSFLRYPTTGVRAMFEIESNETITLKRVRMVYTVWESNQVTNNTNTYISQEGSDSFTYLPVNKKYNLMLILESINPNTTISDDLYRLDAGCEKVTYNMTSLHVVKWNVTLIGLQGPTILQVGKRVGMSGNISLTFVESTHGEEDDDNKLKEWEIALIVLGVVVVIAFVLVFVGGAVWFLWIRRGGYISLNN